MLDIGIYNLRLLFSSWLSRKIEEFLCTLEMDLEQDIGSMESLMGQVDTLKGQI